MVPGGAPGFAARRIWRGEADRVRFTAGRESGEFAGNRGAADLPKSRRLSARADKIGMPGKWFDVVRIAIERFDSAEITG